MRRNVSMGIITQQINLDAGIEKVWSFITHPDNFPKYVYGYSGGGAISSHKTGLGATYEWYGKIGPLKLKSVEEVVAWEKHKRVAYRGKLFGIAFNSSMDVKKMRKNQTQLRVSIQYSIPWLLGGKITDTLLIQKIVQSYVSHSLDQLRIIISHDSRSQ